MNNPTPQLSGDAGFVVEAKNKFFEATRAIVEYEIRPGNTVSFVSEVDLTEVEQVRARASRGNKPSYTAFVVKAVALALRDFPYANRRVVRSLWPPLLGVRLQRFQKQDVAVACERDFPGSESTAFIDIVKDADQLSLHEITDTLFALSQCDASNNKQWREFSTLITRLPCWLSAQLIRLPCFVPKLWVKYRGGAVLISSPAKYGVDAVVGTWSHPLGVSFGLVKPRPVVREGAVVARTTFALTLNFDRRVMAGAQAARFFRRITDVLERAETEMAPYWSDRAPDRVDAAPRSEESPTIPSPAVGT
jgi:hypothetical protein